MEAMMAKTWITTEFGYIKDYPEADIIYNGDFEAGIVITIELAGPADGIRIDNQTRGEYINFDHSKINAIVGSGLVEHDVIIINTTRGNKSAVLKRGGTTYNIMHAVSLTSKWIYLQKGRNHFVYGASDGLNNIFVTIECKTRTLGV